MSRRPERTPRILFARYDTAADEAQRRFLALRGDEDADLLAALTANHADIAAAVPNIRSYVAGGELHTILGRPQFYEFGVDGVTVRDWVASLADFQQVDDVRCSRCDRDSYAAAPDR